MSKITLLPHQFVIGYDFGRKYNHLVYCRIEICPEHPIGYQITHWGALDYPSSTLAKITQQLYQVTQTHHPATQGDWFVLEAQPVGNSRCMVISYVWQALLLSLKKNQHQILFTHAPTKFSILDKTGIYKPLIKVNKPSGTTKYRQRKGWAINLTMDLLQHQPQQFQIVFGDLKKKDDFSDAFLYAVAFIVKNTTKTGIVPLGDLRSLGFPCLETDTLECFTRGHKHPFTPLVPVRDQSNIE